jgi:hypothetical protein
VADADAGARIPERTFAEDAASGAAFECGHDGLRLTPS